MITLEAMIKRATYVGAAWVVVSIRFADLGRYYEHYYMFTTSFVQVYYDFTWYLRVEAAELSVQWRRTWRPSCSGTENVAERTTTRLCTIMLYSATPRVRTRGILV
jgi:hypothetical protein